MADLLPLKDFSGYYAGCDGNIYSMEGGKIKKLKPYLNRCGYYIITIKRKTKILHRLIAKTFLPNPKNLPEVNHINGVRTDNNVKNLEWCSRLENARHSWKFLGRKSSMLGRRGRLSPYSKKVLQIKDGRVIGSFYGAHEAERLTGIKHQGICMCCVGKAKTAGGYNWEYKQEV